MPEDGFQEKATTRIESTAGRGTNDSAKETNDTSSNRRNIDKILKYAPDTKWITDKLSWPFLKPVIRASVSSWICLIFILVQKTEQSLGQAGFLVILAGFIEPPNSPFISVIERQLVMVAFATTAWAWSCLGLKLASLARTEIIPASKVSTTAVFAGAYLEAAPAVICGLFLFTGIVVILFFKSRHGPGPFVYAFVLSCICLNIPLTTGLLFPYPNYSLGRSVVVPLFLQSAVSIICSIIILPETVNAQFIKRLRNIILPLREAIATQPSILATSPLTDDFDMTEFHAKLSVAESGFVPLAATARLLNRDISWGRLSAEDLNGLHDISRKLFLRCNGMEYFYKIIDTNKERFLGTALKTPVTTTMNTPESTRPPSPELHASNISDAAGVTSSASSTNSRKKNRKSRAHFHFPHIPLKVSMFPDISHYNQSHENVVGVFESQKYLNLEARLTHPDTERLTENAIVLLAQSITPLLKACIESLDFFADWLSSVNESRLNVEHIFSRGKRKKWEERVRDSEMALENLEAALNNFRAKERLFILEPYRSEGDPQLTGPRSDAPPHRYLFNSFVYQYNVMYFAMRLVDFLQEVVRFEKERRHNQFWIPKVPLDALFHWSDSDVREEAQGRGDEDPDTIHGYTKRGFDLGETGARDPDALPPHNIFELLGDAAHRFLSGLQGGNTTFALKAGVLTLLLSLPSWITQSAHFAYTNKAVWAIFVGQLSLARFRGDTSFALFARLSSTLFGGVLGLVVWYISAGSGKGNAFGLAATCAVVFPLIIFYRSYSPGPPMTTIVFSTTVAIVIGYSWQDQHLISPSSPGVGASVVWNSFVSPRLSIVSLLPPSTTIRQYLRLTYATTTMELGSLCCAVVSYANSPTREDDADIIKNLLATRAKLRRSRKIQTNIGYEFTLRGRWPEGRYSVLLEIQLETAYLLSHLLSVLENLEYPWLMAILQRSRFLEPEFQGDLLANISMVSFALRTGRPLPQISPGPLLDRFLHWRHGLNVIHTEAEDDFGLPRSVTMSTLADEQYMHFCVGVASAYGIVTRIDRLMVATKQLVGEHFHIEGIGNTTTPKLASKEL